MKRFNFKIVAICILLLIGILGLSGCNKDNENKYGDYFHGYIESAPSQKSLIVSIKVTYSPFDKNGLPRNKDLIFIEKNDFPSINFKENQKVIFSIISAELALMPQMYDYLWWNAKINILKID